jgi:hypothetical protein
MLTREAAARRLGVNPPYPRPRPLITGPAPRQQT